MAFHERGFYSEIAAVVKRKTAPPDKKILLSSDAAVLQSLYRETIGWKHTPPVNRFEFPPDAKITSFKPEELAEKYKVFFKKSHEPKIQLQTHTSYGSCPKRVAVERLKRQYARQNLKDLLESFSIDSRLLIPHSVMSKNHEITYLKYNYLPGMPHEPFLALEIFDDTEFEVRSPQEWLKLGHTSILKKPVPGLAFIPEISVDQGDINFDWQDVAVLDHDDNTGMYLVRRHGDFPEEGTAIITLANLTSGRDSHHEDYWVPRMYMMFYAEDPYRFASRLEAAVRYRQKVEESLRFSLYIDCMPLDGVPVMEQTTVDKIIETACSSPGLKQLECVETYIPFAIKEIQRNHQRTLNSMIFRQVAKQNPCLIDEIPDGSQKTEVPQFGYQTRVNYSFQKKRLDFVSKTIWNRVEVILASHDVREEILVVSNMSLFQVPIATAMRIEEFEKLQSDRLRQVNMYVHDSWLKKLTHAVRTKFVGTGKGWYNLHEKNWFAYQCSKMKSFMNTVNFMMQDSLRYLINESLEQFTEMFTDACTNIMKLEDDFKWTFDYGSDILKPLRNPVFEVDMLVVGTGLKFSVDLMKFYNTVLKLFNEGLTATKDIPQIEKFILEDVFFGEKIVVESVGEHEPHVESWRTSLTTAMEKSIAAIQAYVESYSPVLAFGNTDPPTYVRNFEKQKKSAQELKELIEYHLNERVRLEAMIPDRLAIGPFLIVTRSVRLNVVKKHTSLADALLIYFAQSLRNCLDDISNDFLNLKSQILQKSGNIEDLLDQRKWMETVSDIINDYEDNIRRVKEDYLLLEEFSWVLNYEDFHAYWNTIGLPYVTRVLLEERFGSLEEDKELLRKLLIQDQADLDDHLNIIKEKIAAFSIYHDLSKTQSVATDVRATSKDVKVSKELAELYNKRENLFEMAVTDYSHIGKISESLEPYELFWLSVSEFYKWRERDQTDQLNIERDELERIVDDCYAKICTCPQHFEDYPDILESIKFVLREIEAYKSGEKAPSATESEEETDEHYDEAKVESAKDLQSQTSEDVEDEPSKSSEDVSEVLSESSSEGQSSQSVHDSDADQPL